MDQKQKNIYKKIFLVWICIYFYITWLSCSNKTSHVMVFVFFFWLLYYESCKWTFSTAGDGRHLISPAGPVAIANLRPWEYPWRNSMSQGDSGWNLPSNMQKVNLHTADFFFKPLTITGKEMESKITLLLGFNWDPYFCVTVSVCNKQAFLPGLRWEQQLGGGGLN